MSKYFIENLPEKSRIYTLIKDGDYREAYNLANTRYTATNALYDYPCYIALRKRLFGLKDHIAACEESHLLDHGNLDEISSMGSTYIAVGLDGEAIRVYESCLKGPYFNPMYKKLLDYYESHNMMEDLNRLDKKCAQAGFKGNTEYVKLRSRKGSMSLEEYLSAMEKLSVEYPEVLNINDDLAFTNETLHNYDKALMYFEKLYSQADTYDREVKMLFHIAFCKYHLGNRKEALSDLNMININTLKDNPSLIRKIYELKNGLYKDLNNLAMQIYLTEELCAINPTCEYFVALGNLHKRNQKHLEAKAAFKRAVELATNEEELCDANKKLLEVHLKLGEVRDAVECLKDITSYFDYYSAHEYDLLTIGHMIDAMLDRKVRDHEVTGYFASQVHSYNRDKALIHSSSHENEVFYDKKVHSVFDESISSADVFERVEEMIKNMEPYSYNIGDIYDVEYPCEVAIIDGYPTKTVRVICLMNTKNIVTIYPKELSPGEKIAYDEAKKAQKVVGTKPSKMSAIDKFNQRAAKAKK